MNKKNTERFNKNTPNKNLDKAAIFITFFDFKKILPN